MSERDGIQCLGVLGGRPATRYPTKADGRSANDGDEIGARRQMYKGVGAVDRAAAFVKQSLKPGGDLAAFANAQKQVLSCDADEVSSYVGEVGELRREVVTTEISLV